jgi:hypothetical protein
MFTSQFWLEPQLEWIFPKVGHNRRKIGLNNRAIETIDVLTLRHPYVCTARDHVPSAHFGRFVAEKNGTIEVLARAASYLLKIVATTLNALKEFDVYVIHLIRGAWFRSAQGLFKQSQSEFFRTLFFIDLGHVLRVLDRSPLGRGF